MRIAIFQRGTALLQTVRLLTGSGEPIVVTPPSWRLRITRWLVALSVCFFVFQVYVWFVVPWIEPPPPQFASSGFDPLLDSRTSDAELEELFPPDAWERNNPMELKTKWGKLLFQKYVRINKGIELHPCTILFSAPATDGNGKRSKRTIVLKTANKAVLSFSGDLNLVRAQVGELKGALIEGEVRIFARETHAGANDAINIVTRNIQILPTQIWTPHDVAFEYGLSRGSGRLLSISIGSSDENDSSGTRPGIARNIKMLELVHVDRLHLVLPAKGMYERSSSQPGQGLARTIATKSEVPTTDQVAVDVTCQGPLRFDFQAGVATLQDHVDVVHLNPAGDNDWLRCDKLAIFFKPAKPPAEDKAKDDDRNTDTEQNKPAPTPSGEEQQDRVGAAAISKLAISRIEATGTEVTLHAPSLQAMARGQLLQYDFATRHILLQDPQKVLFVYQQHIVESPRLEYELQDPPNRLGRLWAVGPGVYRSAFGENQQSLQATWNGMLELQPQANLHVLSVTQGADIKWGAMGNFSADKFFVWLDEVEVEPETSTPDPIAAVAAESRNEAAVGPELNGPARGPAHGTAVAAQAGADGKNVGGEQKTEIVPIKMLAQGNVHAAAEQFKGDANHLEIWFDKPISELSRAPTEPPVATQEPPAPGAVPPPDRGEPVVNKTKRLELSGTQIRLRLWMVKPRPTVREATVMGKVRLAQLAPVATADPLLLVTGEMLQLRTDHFDRSTVDVSGGGGQPARVQAQGMLLEGASLHVSQRENLMWSEGPGRTRLPARAHQNQARSTPEHAISSNAPVWISWQGGMDFDGQLIRFMKQVEVTGIYTSKDGEQLYLRAVGDQLHAMLNRYVEFSKTKKTDGLDVAELRFLGEVFARNQTFGPDNALTSQDQMRARDLRLDRRSGEFHAVGPGWIVTTRVDTGNGKSGLVVAPPHAPPRQPVGTRGQDKLIYLRIDFQNAIKGNLDLREGEFIHFVRTVYGPVASWDETLDPDRRGGLAPQGIVMTCNQLKIAEMSTDGQRAIEMSAVGNTIVEGEQFQARADRLTYAQGKEQLILEGFGRNFATLLQRSRVGAKPAEFQASKIIYWVKTGKMKVTGAAKLDYNQIGSPGTIPSARIR